MSVTRSMISQPAGYAAENRTRRMPAYMCKMCAATADIASILRIGTGVVKSVSLFVSVLSLALTGLVGLIGLTQGLTPGTTKGD